jgi:hypothetical protein
MLYNVVVVVGVVIVGGIIVRYGPGGLDGFYSFPRLLGVWFSLRG